jgi:tripartite-type tricarboxylate transporter receptor subunit TctC
LTDFEHVTTLAKTAFLLVVAGQGPFKTVSELTTFLKAQGERASYGSMSNTGLVSSELYKAQFGLPTVEVKYKDPAGLLNDLYNGNLAFAHLDPIFGATPLRDGKIRALATSAREHFKALPSIPSASDVGILNSDIVAWLSVHVPKGTPKPITDLYAAHFNRIATSEDAIKFLAPLGSDPFPGNSELLQDLLKRDIEAWREYVKIAKIEPM